MSNARHWLLTAGFVLAAQSCVLDRGGRLDASDPNPAGGAGGSAVCVEAADCPEVTCRASSCVEGECSTTPEPAGTPCGDGRVCDVAAVCKLPPGEGCDNGEECHAGFCVDGVCCAEACDATCSTCTAVPGECTVYPSGQDPESECPATLSCDGSARCALGEHLFSSAFGANDRVEARAVTVDRDGNIIVALHFTGALTVGANTYNAGISFHDALLVKLDPDGNVVWSEHIGGGEYEDIHALTTDLAGNIYVVGRFSDEIDILGTTYVTPGFDYDGMLFSLSSSGNLRWSKHFTGSLTNAVNDVAITPDGFVVVVGVFDGDHVIEGETHMSTASFDSEVWAAKYNAAGIFAWELLYLAAGDDHAAAVDVTAGGTILIGGHYAGSFDASVAVPMATAQDVFIAHVDAAGATLEVEVHGGPGNQRLTDLTSVGDGWAIAGSFDGFANLGGGPLPYSGSLFDAFAAIFDAAGDPVWSASYGDTGTQEITTIADDNQGNVLFGGYFATGLRVEGVQLPYVSGQDPFLVKVNGSGKVLWSRGLGSTADERIVAGAVGLDDTSVTVGTFGPTTLDFGGAELTNTSLQNHAFVLKLSP